MDGQGHGIRYTGARMGVFGLQSWAPLREPGQPATAGSVANSVNQSVNAGRSAVVHPQPQQSSAQYSMHAEPVANNTASNSNSRELFLSCLHLHLMWSCLSIIFSNCINCTFCLF